MRARTEKHWRKLLIHVINCLYDYDGVSWITGLSLVLFFATVTQRCVGTAAHSSQAALCSLNILQIAVSDLHRRRNSKMADDDDDRSNSLLSYELLRWLVETPSRDIYRYRMLNVSAVQHWSLVGSSLLLPAH